MTTSRSPTTRHQPWPFGEIHRLLGALPREINYPEFGPGFSAIYGGVTLPVGGPLLDPGSCEPEENIAPSLILPLAVKVDGAAFKSSAPDQETTRADVSVHVRSH